MAVFDTRNDAEYGMGLSATLSAPTPLLLTATTAAGVWLLAPRRPGSR